MRRERSGRDYIADAKKLHYPKIPSAEIHIMRIGDLEPNSDSSNEKIEEEYISLDSPLATLISATRLN